MSTKAPDKLRVLVVDDDKDWVEGLQTQSQELTRSRLDIEISQSFKGGLNFLEETRENENAKDFDVVVVDNFLDHSHLAAEFISKARELGIVVPYIIVSGAEITDVVHDRTNLDNLVQSAPADFIEKTDIRNFAKFQERVFESHRKFRENVLAIMASYFGGQKENLHNIWVLACEVRHLHRTAQSYSAKIADASFTRVCSAIGLDIDKLLSYVQYAIAQIPDHPELNNPALVSSRELTDKAKTTLELADHIPYSKQKGKIVSWLARCERGIIALRGDTEALKSIVRTVLAQEKKTNLKFAEIVILHLAERLARAGQVNEGADLLFYLSQQLAELRQSPRVAGTDMLTAAFLIDHGKSRQAQSYLSAARRLASRTKDDQIAGMINRLSPSH